MVPCRLTGKPFWDIYLYRDPPLWKAYIDAVKHFDIDGGIELYDFGSWNLFDDSAVSDWEERIVLRTDERIITQGFQNSTGAWSGQVTLYTRDNPPVWGHAAAEFGLPPTPPTWEPVVRKPSPLKGLALWNHIRQEMGEQGLVGFPSGMCTSLLQNEADIFTWYDNPAEIRRRAEGMMQWSLAQMEKIAKMDPKPDFLFCGGSGTLVFQTPDFFREIILPILKKITDLAHDIGIPTHIHSCGPEKLLVRMAAEETKLTIIDPLEIPPMGDCILADLKQQFGRRLVLKGNLHTTDVMLRGTVEQVRAASRKAIDDAGAGGGFILSTGDQCGRDTPDANLRAMVEVARTYGKY